MNIGKYFSIIYDNEKKPSRHSNEENLVNDNFFMYLFFTMFLGILISVAVTFLIPHKSVKKFINLQENKNNSQYLVKVEKIDKLESDLKKLDLEIKKLKKELISK